MVKLNIFQVYVELLFPELNVPGVCSRCMSLLFPKL